jgi:hypothetical protein
MMAGTSPIEVPSLQHQGRHDAARIDRPVGLRVLFARTEIDSD